MSFLFFYNSDTADFADIGSYLGGRISQANPSPRLQPTGIIHSLVGTSRSTHGSN